MELKRVVRGYLQTALNPISYKGESQHVHAHCYCLSNGDLLIHQQTNWHRGDSHDAFVRHLYQREDPDGKYNRTTNHDGHSYFEILLSSKNEIDAPSFMAQGITSTDQHSLSFRRLPSGELVLSEIQEEDPSPELLEIVVQEIIREFTEQGITPIFWSGNRMPVHSNST